MNEKYRVCPEKIPEGLKDRDQWVLWKEVDRKGKMVKIPLAPWSTGHNGPANALDVKNQTDFKTALETAEKNGVGIGFVFTADDDYCGVDLDDCIIDNEIKETTKEILDTLNSYTEYSPKKRMKPGDHIL